MTSRLATVILPALVLLAPAAVVGQVQTQLTITMPIRVTLIGPDVSKVMVSCQLSSSAIPQSGMNRTFPSAKVEFPLSDGELTTDASLVFSLAGLVDPKGKEASVLCNITGWSVSRSQWVEFTPTTTNLSFRTTDPTTTSFKHDFTW